MKTIAVFGATGRTGKPFTELALKEGYTVKALLRTPSKLGIQNLNLQIIEGDLSDPAKVEETINGTEAVLLLVGMSPMVRDPIDLRAIMTRNILDAMEKSGVKRIIRLSSFVGARDVNDKFGFMMKAQLSMYNKNIIQDETCSTDLIRQSNFDWTIVRNAMITANKPKGVYKAGYVGEGKDEVTAGDLAAFILEELKTGKYMHQMPFIRN